MNCGYTSPDTLGFLKKKNCSLAPDRVRGPVRQVAVKVTLLNFMITQVRKRSPVPTAGVLFGSLN